MSDAYREPLIGSREELPAGDGIATSLQALAADPSRPPGMRRAVLPHAAGPERGGAWRAFCLGAVLPLVVLAGATALGLVSVDLGGRTPGMAGPLDPRSLAEAKNIARFPGDRPGNRQETQMAAYAEPVAAPGAGGAAGNARIVAELGDVGRQIDGLRLLTSVVVLDEAARRSRPFIAELALAIKAAQDDPALLARLDQLMPWAETGAATEEELARRFTGLAQQARLVAAEGQGAMLQGATLLMRDMALWIGIGEPPPADLQHVLTRATAAVERGSLGEAAQTLAALEEPALGVVRPWLANVTARASIDGSLEQFRHAALERALGQVE